MLFLAVSISWKSMLASPDSDRLDLAMQICEPAYCQVRVIYMRYVESPGIQEVVENSRDRQSSWIVEILRVRQWTPTELARRAGISQPTLRSEERRVGKE